MTRWMHTTDVVGLHADRKLWHRPQQLGSGPRADLPQFPPRAWKAPQTPRTSRSPMIAAGPSSATRARACMQLWIAVAAGLGCNGNWDTGKQMNKQAKARSEARVLGSPDTFPDT